MNDALSQEVLSKGQREHLWRDIKLLTEAKKSPDGTFITKEIIGNHQIIHAVMPLGGMPQIGSDWMMLGTFLVIYTAIIIKAWDRFKSKEDLSKVFGCRQCGIWMSSAQEYYDHYMQFHNHEVKEKE